MKNVIIFLILIVTFPVFAAEKVTQQPEATSVVTTDMLMIIDDPGGTPVSKKITVANFLKNWVGSSAITTLGTIATGVWNGTAIAVGYGGTGAATLTDGGILLGSGTSAITALGAAANGQIPIGDGTTDPVLATITGTANEVTVTNGAGTITLSLPDPIVTGVTGNVTGALTGNASTASVATTVTITDNEDTAENNPIVFVAGGDLDGGNLGLESDGTTYYTPSTGTITATEFVGGGAGLTAIDAATGDSATDFFDAGEIADARISNTLTSSTCTGNAATVTTNANLTGEVTSVGNAATIADSVTVTGWVLGTSSATQLTSPTLITNLIDTTGAADMDYGSVDVTDHTFITDGTGTAEIVLPAGSIDGTEILDDTVDSDDYAAGSIDEEHLNATNAPGAEQDNYVLTYNHAGTNFTWAADADTGAATAWDDIGDPDAAATVDFVTYTQTIDIGVTDVDGPKSGLILDVTGLGAGATDVIALEITTAANDDPDYIPIAIYDDSEVDNDLIFRVNSGGGITMAAGGQVYNNTNAIVLYDNLDTIKASFGGTDCDIIWSDGALNLRNAEDGIDAIVNIQGKDAGEKGILRIMSDGDDKYIELHHDDSDAHLTSSSGGIHIEPPAGSAITFDGTVTVDAGVVAGITSLTATNITGTASAATLAATATTVTAADESSDTTCFPVFVTAATGNLGPKTGTNLTFDSDTGTLGATILTTATNIKAEPKHLMFTIIDPLSTQTEDNEICLWPVTPAALTVTKIVITLDAAGNEVAGDLKWADAFIGLAGATVINTFDTTSGVLSDDSITAGTVAAGKCMYIAFDSAPNTAIKQMCVDITYSFD